jgi:hypothetical protein
VDYIKTLILKWFLGSRIEALLSKLPANGAKSLLSFIATLLAIVAGQAQGAFAFGDILAWVQGLAQSGGGEVVLTAPEIAALAGAAQTVVFLCHKVLKSLKRDWSAKPPKRTARRRS